MHSEESWFSAQSTCWVIAFYRSEDVKAKDEERSASESHAMVRQSGGGTRETSDRPVFPANPIRIVNGIQVHVEIFIEMEISETFAQLFRMRITCLRPTFTKAMGLLTFRIVDFYEPHSSMASYNQWLCLLKGRRIRRQIEKVFGDDGGLK